MLAKINRLSRQKDFKRVLTKGKSFFSPAFRLRYLANESNLFCVAVIVSSKVSKKATVRNRLKRQTLEIIRLNLDKIKPGYDLLVYLSSQALKSDYGLLKHEFLANLSKLRMLK